MTTLQFSLEPVDNALYDLMGLGKVAGIERGIIEIAPLAYMRALRITQASC